VAKPETGKKREPLKALPVSDSEKKYFNPARRQALKVQVYVRRYASHQKPSIPNTAPNVKFENPNLAILTMH
jgi:hypothetical protein